MSSFESVKDDVAFSVNMPNAHASDCCLQASKKIAEACCLLVLVDGTEDMVKHLRLIAAVADEMGRP